MQSVSVIKKSRSLYVWLGITVFCMLFACIYEIFSFGVWSNAMVFCFLYPLLLGVIPTVFFGTHMGRLWNDGILLLTAGSILTGIFEIYGTTSVYPGYMMLGGAVLIIIRAVSLIIRLLTEKRHG